MKSKVIQIEYVEESSVRIKDYKYVKPRIGMIAIVGEIFMRDNPFCNGYVESRLEALGAETITAPFCEWLTYSTYRYSRDSIWKRDN